MNAGSTHTRATFAAIPQGVLGRLAKLTTPTQESKNRRLDKLYPEHAKALRRAGLAPRRFPRLNDELMRLDATPQSGASGRKLQNRRRCTYFCVGYSTIWQDEPISAVIKRLKKKYGLRWLRFSMSYHRFPNVRELFRSDVERELNTGLLSEDYKDRPCNCNDTCKRNGICLYGQQCRKSCVVYSVTCRQCQSIYTGSTAQYLKKRINGHLNVTQAWANGVCKACTTLAGHLSDHLKSLHPPSTKFTCGLVRALVEVKPIWQGDPLSVMKSFRTRSSGLCNEERIQILKTRNRQPNNVINTRIDLMRGCHHTPKFHRYSHL